VSIMSLAGQCAEPIDDNQTHGGLRVFTEGPQKMQVNGIEQKGKEEYVGTTNSYCDLDITSGLYPSENGSFHLNEAELSVGQQTTCVKI